MLTPKQSRETSKHQTALCRRLIDCGSQVAMRVRGRANRFRSAHTHAGTHTRGDTHAGAHTRGGTHGDTHAGAHTRGHTHMEVSPQTPAVVVTASKAARGSLDEWEPPRDPERAHGAACVQRPGTECSGHRGLLANTSPAPQRTQGDTIKPHQACSKPSRTWKGTFKTLLHSPAPRRN